MFKMFLGLFVFSTVSTTSYAQLTFSDALFALSGFMTVVVQTSVHPTLRECR